MKEIETRVREFWAAQKSLPIISEALRALDHGTPRSRYPYHNTGHAEDVAREALALALCDRRSVRDLELLALASTYHDIGYLYRYDRNEAFAAAILEQAMRDYGGYTDEEVTACKTMIMGTVVKPHPQGGLLQSVAEGDILGGYLADADLGNLGNETFTAQSNSLFNELVIHGKIPADTPEARMAFGKGSLLLLKNHTYYTRAAQVLRQPHKMKNLAALELKI